MPRDPSVRGGTGYIAEPRNVSGRLTHVLCKAQNDTYGGGKRNTWGIGSYGEMSISILCQAVY